MKTDGKTTSRRNRYGKTIALAVEVLAAQRREIDAIEAQLAELERYYDALLAAASEATR
jgi:cyclopropane fatty-acyl-phospholipid synthase-like methyltransferase